MAKKPTHKQTVLNALQLGEHVTSYRMFQMYGISRLSAHIYNLRNEGYDIKQKPSDIYEGFDAFYIDKDTALLEAETEIMGLIQDKYNEGSAHNSPDGAVRPTLTSSFLFDTASKALTMGL